MENMGETATATSSITASILQFALINSGKIPGSFGQFLTPVILSTLAPVIKKGELRLAQPNFAENTRSYRDC